MNSPASAPTPALHRISPHGDRVSPWVVAFAITAAPSAWILQLLLSAGLAAHACYPHDVPLSQPLWNHLTTIIAMVDGCAFVVAAAGGITSWRFWQLTRHEQPGQAMQLSGGGEGRARFLAMVGMMTSGLFLLAIVFAASNLAAVPACAG